jgi:predicted DNA-binding transcriptional regulator AlpA
MMNVTLNTLPEAVTRKRLLGIEPTAEFVGRSVPEIRRLIRLGLFPKPLKLNGRRLSWRLGDIVDWIDSKTEPKKTAA